MAGLEGESGRTTDLEQRRIGGLQSAEVKDISSHTPRMETVIRDLTFHGEVQRLPIAEIRASIGHAMASRPYVEDGVYVDNMLGEGVPRASDK
ncbi:MAG: hypothetical protein WC897_00505 [Candidatus Gracilibacteria bacterium]